MKLRQTFTIGLMSVVFALPVIAAESRMDLNQAKGLSSTATPSQKEATPLKKTHKRNKSKQPKEKGKRNELNAASQTVENGPTEKGSIEL
ncbi:hypothetical protein BEV13_05055 [Rickettsiella grylli]|uniref:hypothetical protein n=1 Tax=Rickettsiella grylli TaxID=59196 RepID=UPI0008FD2361|nr:hypothetical protein [Rickettsiella grylli]OIZ99757.1 hypothetical protein BEV13_05055 [Rickettsiella grylli]